MASLIDRAAQEWGFDSNWNARRGSGGLADEFAGQYGGDANWNALRPSSAPAAAPSGGGSLAPSAPAPAPSQDNGTSAMLEYMKSRDQQRDAENAGVRQMQRDTLLRLMGQDTNAASVNDPDIKPQADAFRLARDRAAKQEREMMAERAANTGLNYGGQGSGAFESGLQGIAEQAGQDKAGFEADLVGRRLDARRQQLMQALQLADALGARSEANTLQSELAQIDAGLRQNALGVQSSLGRGQLGLGLLNSMMGNQQFYDQMGYNYADLTSRLNRDAFLSLM